MPFGLLAAPADRTHALFSPEDFRRQRAYFAAHPELRPTPLVRLDALASALGLADLRVKDETARFGLNAFKAAGAMFAVAALRADGAVRAGDTLVCASEGNHGRAVARAARDAGCHARVYMAERASPARTSAIEQEGAVVVRVAGTYDDALRAMARDAAAHGWRVVSDTALDGEPTDVPRLIMLGYTRIVDEIGADDEEEAAPDVLFVPGGVGGLLAAVADSVRARHAGHGPRVVCVEPITAACLQASARAGRPTVVPGPFETELAGLRCGEVSHAAFDAVRSSVDAFVAIEDEWAFDAMRRLAQPAPQGAGLRAGASGAAALGGLMAVLTAPELVDVRRGLALGRASRAVAIVSEGATDPGLFARVVGDPKNEHLGA